MFVLWPNSCNSATTSQTKTQQEIIERLGTSENREKHLALLLINVSLQFKHDVDSEKELCLLQQLVLMLLKSDQASSSVAAGKAFCASLTKKMKKSKDKVEKQDSAFVASAHSKIESPELSVSPKKTKRRSEIELNESVEASTSAAQKQPKKMKKQKKSAVAYEKIDLASVQTPIDYSKCKMASWRKQIMDRFGVECVSNTICSQDRRVTFPNGLSSAAHFATVNDCVKKQARKRNHKSESNVADQDLSNPPLVAAKKSRKSEDESKQSESVKSPKKKKQKRNEQENVNLNKSATAESEPEDFEISRTGSVNKSHVFVTGLAKHTDSNSLHSLSQDILAVRRCNKSSAILEFATPEICDRNFVQFRRKSVVIEKSELQFSLLYENTKSVDWVWLQSLPKYTTEQHVSKALPEHIQIIMKHLKGSSGMEAYVKLPAAFERPREVTVNRCCVKVGPAIQTRIDRLLTNRHEHEARIIPRQFKLSE